jgi:2',3'-cyclic-nucleotide 2'-phosphodiesterase (5'-nucleotidase family)
MNNGIRNGVTGVVLSLIVLAVVGCSTPRPSGSETPEQEADSQKQEVEDQTRVPTTKRDGAEQVTVLFVADLHAQLEQHPELFWSRGKDRIETAGGLARVARAIERIREARDGEVLVVDGGDTIQGSGAAALTDGRAVVPGLNKVGVDVGIPGNWSVAYGPAVLRKRLKNQFEHEIVAHNVYDEASGDRLFDPYTVREVGGVKVAIIGYTDPDIPTRQPPEYSRGLSFSGPDKLPGLIKEVRRERGAEVVLLSSHIGLSKAVSLTDELPGFDAHLSADTHERTYDPINREGTWVVEPGAFGSFMGRLDFWVRDGDVVDREWKLIELTADKFGRDSDVVEAVQRAKQPVEETLNEEIGYTDSKLVRYNVLETSLDNLLADALRDATGTDIALSNGFRFGYPVLPGPITQGDLWRFYPIVTRLKTAEVTGRQLRRFWERELDNVFADEPAERFGGWVPRPSGMSVTFEADAPAGERVREIRVHGEPIDSDETYTITACEREGEPKSTICRIPNADDAQVHELNAHEAVRSYLAEHERVESSLEGRVDATDLPPVLRTQMLDFKGRRAD